MRGKLDYDLSRLVDAIASVEGVLAVILFGSVARGEYDEFSDYDLLVLFRDEECMWRGWDTLFQRVGELRLPVHVIPKTLEEFKEKTEPTFRSEVMTTGRIIYMRYPLQTPCIFAAAKPHVIIAYSLSKLKQREKMRLIHELYRKRDNALSRARGWKISDSVLIVPREGFNEMMKVFEKHRVKPIIIETYL
ncbi:MAG: nucleotidyltransferase domain-containing protein [Candidatus Caldarchaeum sp.]|nr:nucleotidyltransferase domain-containing protein [Candidatus Caldarchaeum sp.]